ncbi:MAG TPA: DoxX family protein [Xanthobacteraceae bacterium]|jgi:thiosulfate dehydrogenase [quinone] large subunit
MSQTKSDHGMEQILIVFFRLTMGWTFLWAGIHHFGDDKFVVGFLSNVKTFHDVYAPFTNPTVVPALTFLVEYGHLLIGLSLVSGLLMRVSAPFAIMLMLLYWTAHMDYPYIEDANNYLIDYHIVYAGVLVYLLVKRAGHVFGLDGMISKMGTLQQSPMLRWIVA